MYSQLEFEIQDEGFLSGGIVHDRENRGLEKKCQLNVFAPRPRLGGAA